MFNDDVKKSAVQGVLYIMCFVCIIGALVMGLVFSALDENAENAEKAREEVAPTAEYEKDETLNNMSTLEVEEECEHRWVFSEEEATLIRTVKLACVASGGLEKVYLTRYREEFDNTTGDLYIAYDENLKDITLNYWSGSFEIEYFPAGVGMGTPRMEEYEFELYVCANENCNHMQHVAGTTQKRYIFYIPEGTYLISH